MLSLIEIRNICLIDNDNCILYQKNYNAECELVDESTRKKFIFNFIFTIEETPINFNFYIRQIFNTNFQIHDIKNILIPELEKWHNTQL